VSWLLISRVRMMTSTRWDYFMEKGNVIVGQDEVDKIIEGRDVKYGINLLWEMDGVIMGSTWRITAKRYYIRLK
jgi:hypothetical protein